MLALVQSIINSSKAPVISSRLLLKSIDKGNLYLGPLHIISGILVSVMIFKFPVTI